MEMKMQGRLNEGEMEVEGEKDTDLEKEVEM